METNMSKNQHFTDLAEAVESLKDSGYVDLSEKRGPHILDVVKRTSIEQVHAFQDGTDPGYESTLYQLHDDEGNTFFIITSFGMYQDRDKSGWVDILERNRP